MSTEASTQQRPWWQVAPFPGPNAKGEWDDPETYESGCRAHYAAMTLAYSKALAAAILAARTPEDSAKLRATLFLPMTAAFTAAASLDSGEDWTINRIRDLLADPGDVADFCHDWLANGGIDPDDIAPATGPDDLARSLAVHLEQELAEATRLLRELATTAAALDAWPSGRHIRALQDTERYLTRTVTP